MIYDKLAPYYDQFIDPELNDTYFEWVTKYAQPGTVLDLGCGTAPLAVRLANEGYFVTGTDISEAMLERAMNNAVEHGVDIRFYLHDILEPINQTYDVILMTSDVINYLRDLDEVAQALGHVADAMTEESIFLFDFIHIQYVERIHNYHEDILLDDDVLQWSVRKTNEPHQIKHTLSFGRQSDSHLQTTHPQRVYKRLLDEAGLKVVKKRRTEERIIFLCKRK